MIRGIYDSNSLAILLQGHANYAPKGRDIVCAGVSALAFTYACHTGEYKRCERGMLIKAKKDSPSEREIFEVIVRGLRLIAKDYPENLLLTKGRLCEGCDTQERLQKEENNEIFI